MTDLIIVSINGKTRCEENCVQNNEALHGVFMRSAMGVISSPVNMILVNISYRDKDRESSKTDGCDGENITFYTSTKSWRGYIFTAVCLCV